MISLIVWLISVVVFGTIGGFIAKKDGWAVWIGILIGAVFNLLGVVFLAGVWLSEKFVDAVDKATSK